MAQEPTAPLDALLFREFRVLMGIGGLTDAENPHVVQAGVFNPMGCPLGDENCVSRPNGHVLSLQAQNTFALCEMIYFIGAVVAVPLTGCAGTNCGFRKAHPSLPMNCRMKQFADKGAVLGDIWLNVLVSRVSHEHSVTQWSQTGNSADFSLYIGKIP